MGRGSDSPKVREWQRRLARFGRTRVSVVEFCRDEGVSPASFYQWRRKLSRLQPEHEQADGGPAGFTPVRVVGSAGLVVQLPGGTRLQVPTADPHALELVLQTLARLDAERAGGESC